ncbi:30S ribosomal protein S19 [Candidatus Woesearchaeota archaeon]|nr:30S ribosomal protein S19 [Candidatus Woesearchaeota archaeon]
MARKEFTYRGKTVEELRAMNEKEVYQLLPARARRSLLRGWTDAERKLMQAVKAGKSKIKTQCRDMVILPIMVGATLMVYRGNRYDIVAITEEMIGHRLGEFVLTRHPVKHSAPGIGATRSSASISVK